MNTVSSIIDSMLIEVNEEIINNLNALGYSSQEATKVVSEFSFDLVEDAALNPVLTF